MEQNASVSRFSSPLCLENICRINLLFRLEEFPVQQLLFLPLSIRRDLSLSLSPVDVLHYEAAGLFHDFDTTNVVKSAHWHLLSVTLGSRSNSSELFDSTIMFALVNEEQLEARPCPIFEHISQSFSSLPLTAVKMSLWSPFITLFPNRYSLFFSLDRGLYDPSLKSLKPLLQYCHFLKAPKVVQINVSDFLSSRVWPEFRVMTRRDGTQDPGFPFLQSFLSQVETIDLYTFEKYGELRVSYNVEGMMEFIASEPDYLQEQTALHVIIYNLVSQQRPCLTHLKIHGFSWEIIELLLAVARPFFCDSLPGSFPIQLASDPPNPYFLKSLSVSNNDMGSECKEPYETLSSDRDIAANVSIMARNVVLFQLKSLEHVSINFGTGFCYESTDDRKTPGYAERNYGIPEYRELLSTLIDLLKQPQLQSFTVGRAYLTEAYQLIEVFLCTEANHTQSLTIEGVEEESKWVMVFSDSESIDSEESYKQWRKDESDEESIEENSEEQGNVPTPTHPLHSPPAQPLPDSNGALKSLDIGRSSDRLHAWLFSIPNLQLKELKTSRPDLVPISGVTFVVIDSSVET